ncbi:hypothetical protein AKO1_006350 [Acrasis kona]|uniref:Uncharacterized protein n=1 Tax=Acrasis kona TaxID=1008807 RepID=A0AAW2YJ35_9EUKA
MGKNKSSNKLQRSAEVEGAISDNYINTAHSKGLSQKQIEERVNKVHEIFGDWPKVDIRRALEENEYDDDRVIRNHLDGVDQWQSVKKKADQPTQPRPKTNRRNNQEPRGIQNDRTERGGRGRGRGAVGRTSSNNLVSTEPIVKEYTTTTTYDNFAGTEDQPSHSRAFRSFAEVAAFVNVEEPQPPAETVITTTTHSTSSNDYKTTNKKKARRHQNQDQQPVTETTVVTTTSTVPAYVDVAGSDYSTSTSFVEPSAQVVSQTSSSPDLDVIGSPTNIAASSSPLPSNVSSSASTAASASSAKAISSPSQDSANIILPNQSIYNNRLNVQFGSLGINDSSSSSELASAPSIVSQEDANAQSSATNVVQSTPSVQSTTSVPTTSSNVTSSSSATSAPQSNMSTNDYSYSQSWGNDVNDYNGEMPYGEESGHVDPSSIMGAQYPHQPYNAFGMYGAHPHHQPQVPPQVGGARGNTDPKNATQRTSPNTTNASYNKVGVPPYAQPPYPSLQPHSAYQYPYHYMMPNQFQYYNYPGGYKSNGTHFYGKPYGYPTSTSASSTSTNTSSTSTNNNANSSTAPPQEDDYAKQFMEQQQQYYNYMGHQQQQQHLPPVSSSSGANASGANSSSDKLKSGNKDNRGADVQQQGVPLTMDQQQMGYGFYPQHMPYMGNSQYNYMFHTPQQYGLQHQYQPTQPSGQQANQSHNTKSGRDQQQQSSLSTGWQ